MATGPSTRLPADQANQCVARLQGTSLGARMSRAARTIHFTRRNACEPHLRPLFAPYWSIAIPDRRGRAGERLTCGNHRQEKKSEHGGHIPDKARRVSEARQERGGSLIACLHYQNSGDAASRPVKPVRRYHSRQSTLGAPRSGTGGASRSILQVGKPDDRRLLQSSACPQSGPFLNVRPGPKASSWRLAALGSPWTASILGPPVRQACHRHTAARMIGQTNMIGTKVMAGPQGTGAWARIAGITYMASQTDL